jgi:uncharacterized protein
MKNKWIAVVLIGAAAAWLIMTILPSRNASQQIKPANERPDFYEPKFKHEGNLWVLHPTENDTITDFKIEFADTYAKIQYGMMYRKSMDPKTGMLFLMGDSDWRSFYMKNTYVSLDIIFVDENNRVVSIQKNAEPLNTRSLPSEGPAMYVFEIAGGLSDALGIDKGARIYWERI